MDEEIIDDIAETLAYQLQQARSMGDPSRSDVALLAVIDDIQAMACVINRHKSTYDLRYFYKATGHPEPYPVHNLN